ncbi:MAG TPA: lipoyl(octanoyl) transferase LipB [Cytophagaceae bacterium]|jgi:lipoyl(octanoyl) transferase|nr:lipoyl(octanoyl) transferase LipB [Cytophagaceae bacterium]
MNEIINKKVFFRHLGTIEYKEAWDYQTEIFNKIIAAKIENRELSEKTPTENYLFFCEHPHVYTLGKSGSKENLLASPEMLNKRHATFYEINRGGDITYHGPGQIVGYPILDLDNFFTDIHKYMRSMEEAVIRTLQEYNIEAGRIAGMTGVWLDAQNPGSARKICAFGVKTSRWVTMHGFAFNVNTDLSYFGNIIPCGISDKAVTSLNLELGYMLDMKEVEDKLLQHLADIFDMEIVK